MGLMKIITEITHSNYYIKGTIKDLPDPKNVIYGNYSKKVIMGLTQQSITK